MMESLVREAAGVPEAARPALLPLPARPLALAPALPAAKATAEALATSPERSAQGLPSCCLGRDPSAVPFPFSGEAQTED